MGVDVVYNHADYRLASSKVLQHLADLRKSICFFAECFHLLASKAPRFTINGAMNGQQERAITPV